MSALNSLGTASFVQGAAISPEVAAIQTLGQIGTAAATPAPTKSTGGLQEGSAFGDFVFKGTKEASGGLAETLMIGVAGLGMLWAATKILK